MIFSRFSSHDHEVVLKYLFSSFDLFVAWNIAEVEEKELTKDRIGRNKWKKNTVPERQYIVTTYKKCT